MSSWSTDDEMFSVKNILAPMFRSLAYPNDVERLYFYAIRAEWANVGNVEHVSTYDDPVDVFGRRKQAVDIRLKAKSITVVAETPEGKTVMIHSDAVENVNLRHIALAPSPSYQFGSMDQHVYDKGGGEYRLDAMFSSYSITETVGAVYEEHGPTGLFLPSSTFVIPPNTRGFRNVEL